MTPFESPSFSDLARALVDTCQVNNRSDRANCFSLKSSKDQGFGLKTHSRINSLSRFRYPAPKQTRLDSNNPFRVKQSAKMSFEKPNLRTYIARRNFPRTSKHVFQALRRFHNKQHLGFGPAAWFLIALSMCFHHHLQPRTMSSRTNRLHRATDCVLAHTLV
jgi:hypothetical protein